MHRSHGGRASFWRLQYVWHRFQGWRSGLPAAVYPGQIRGGKNRRRRTGHGRHESEGRRVAVVAERVSPVESRVLGHWPEVHATTPKELRSPGEGMLKRSEKQALFDFSALLPENRASS